MATITGTSSSDSLYGTSGSEKINAGDGDDILYYNLTMNSLPGTSDIYTGGAGLDMVVLQFTFNQWNNASNQLQLTNYFNWRANVKTNSVGEISNGQSSDFTFTFGASTLKIQMMEQLGVMVDGKWLGGDFAVYTRQGPTAHDDTASMTEDDSSVLIDVLSGANGADSVPELVKDLQLVGEEPAHGTVTLVKTNPADPGSWKFEYAVNHADYQYLAANTQATDSFQYQVTDVNGKTATATVTVTINGVNDLATISNKDTNLFSVTEDAIVNIAQGKMIVSDPDAGQNYFQNQSQANGTYGIFSIDVEGSYIYTLDNTRAAVQSLRGGESQTDQFTITSQDGSVSQTLVFIVQGTNDAAEISEPSNRQLTEDELSGADNMLVATGTIAITDKDTGQSSFQTIVHSEVGNIGILSLLENGSYSYAIDNAKVQYLAEDEKWTEFFTITSSDGTTRQISFVTNGVNDMSVISGNAINTFNVKEDTANNIAQGKMTVTDADQSQSYFQSQSQGSATYGAFLIDVDGNYKYTLNNLSNTVQSLREGEIKTEQYTITSQDGTASKTLTFTVQGTNDAAEIGNPSNNQLTEDLNPNTDKMLVATGMISIQDKDTGQSGFITNVLSSADNIGTLVLQESGSYSYLIDNSKIQYLGTSIKHTDTFTVTSIDGVSKQIGFVTTGVNDPATMAGDITGRVLEAGGVGSPGIPVASGRLTTTDIDNPSNKFIALSDLNTTYGKYSIDVNGSWTYTLDNANTTVNALTSTSLSLFDTFDVQSIDGTPQRITIRISGADDISPPIVNPDTLFVSSNTAVTLSTNVLLKNDTDIDKTKLSVTAMTDASGSYGLKLNSDGTFSFNSGADEGSLTDPTTYTFTYTVTNASTGLEAQETVTVIIATPKLDNSFDLSFLDYDFGYLVALNDVYGGTGDDVIIDKAGDGELYGGKGDDTLYGEAGNDQLFGEIGNDVLYGGDGNDDLYGEEGNDALYGGAGNDQLFGYEGNDALYGGSGADKFNLSADGTIDTILDFSTIDGDKILIEKASFPGPVQLSFDHKGTGVLFYDKSSGEIFYESVKIGLIGSDADRNLTAQSFELV